MAAQQGADGDDNDARLSDMLEMCILVRRGKGDGRACLYIL